MSIELPAKGKAAPVGPAGPDRPYGQDQLTHPRCRVRPRHREPFAAGAHRAFVLLADTPGSPPSLGHIARQAALEADVGMGLHVHLGIQHGAEFGPVEHEQALDDEEPGGLDAPRFGSARVIGEGVDRLIEGATGRDGQQVFVQQLPIERIGVVEVDLLALFEGNLLHAAIVGIEGNNRGPRQSLCELLCQLGFPGAGRTRNTNDVRSHYSDGGVISVYNPSTAATRPSTLKTLACVATSMPSWRAVTVVMGPMEATGMPRRASAPTASTRLRTVEELVKVRRSGRTARTSRARSARCSGRTVR